MVTPVGVGGTGSEILTWGGNDFLQLGNGTGTGRLAPGAARLPRGTTITRIACGWCHGLAVTSAGQVLGWGWNAGGQLADGTGTNRDRAVPAQLPSNVRAVAVAGGELHSVVLASDGQVYTCGDNLFGALGLGDYEPRYALTRVAIAWTRLGLPERTTITAVSTFADTTMALTSTGQVLAWGANRFGQLGTYDGYSDGGSWATPVLVRLPPKVRVTAIAAGESHSLALASTGELYAWGANDFGQLGDPGASEGPVPVLVPLPPGAVVTAVAAGQEFSLALTGDGSVLAWGCNIFGELGNGSGNSHSTPVAVRIPAGVTATGVAAGLDHSLALTSTGRVLGWGYNRHGGVGDGTATVRRTPVWARLRPGVKVHAVAAGGWFSAALASR